MSHFTRIDFAEQSHWHKMGLKMLMVVVAAVAMVVVVVAVAAMLLMVVLAAAATRSARCAWCLKTTNFYTC